MTDAITISEVVRIYIDQTVETGDSIDKTEVEPGMHRIKGEGILEVTQECIIALKDKTIEESMEMKVMAEVEKGNRSGERSFSRDFRSDKNNRSTNNSRCRSGSRTSTNRDRIRCYKCSKYNHFAKGLSYF